MKKVYFTLALLVATCAAAVADAPRTFGSDMKKGAVIPTKNERVMLNVNHSKSLVPQKAPGDTIYFDDFEAKTTTWTFDSLESKNISQLGLANSIEGSQSGAFSAFSGTQFLASSYDEKEDVKVYIKSPVIALPAGDYWVGAFFMTGGSYYPCSATLLYGNTDNVASQTKIISFTEEDVSQEWTLQKHKVTISEGNYYFTLVLEYEQMSNSGGGWFVAMDNFMITKNEPFPPEPELSQTSLTIYGGEGVWSLTNDSIAVAYLANDSSNLSVLANYAYCDTVYMKYTEGKVRDFFAKKYSDLEVWVLNTEDNPIEINLSIYGESEMGKDSISDTIAIYHDYANKDYSDVVTNRSLEYRGSNLYLSLLGDRYFNEKYQPDLFTGYGERFAVNGLYAESGSEKFVQLDSVSLMIYNYWLEEENQAKKLKISVYGEKYELDDESNIVATSIGDLYGSVEMTFAEAFGKDTYIEFTPTLVNIKLPTPLSVPGVFYLFIEPIEEMELASDETCDVLLNLVREGYTATQIENGLLYYPANSFYVVYKGEKQSWYDFFGNFYATVTGTAYYSTAVGFLNAGITFYADKVEPIPDTAIKTTKADSQLSIYPNPAKEVIYINNLTSDASATVTDVTGKQILSLSHVQNSVSVSGLSKGIYFISIKDADGVHTAKFVKE